LHANAAAAQLFPIENPATETWLTRASFTARAAGNASAAPVAKPQRILQHAVKSIGSAVKPMKTAQFLLKLEYQTLGASIQTLRHFHDHPVGYFNHLR